jgi:hypothetical protein
MVSLSTFASQVLLATNQPYEDFLHMQSIQDAKTVLKRKFAESYDKSQTVATLVAYLNSLLKMYKQLRIDLIVRSETVSLETAHQRKTIRVNIGKLAGMIGKQCMQIDTCVLDYWDKETKVVSDVVKLVNQKKSGNVTVT